MYHSALVVHKSEQAFGSYTIKQLPSDDVFVTRRLSGTTRLPLHTTVGAFTVSGSIDTVSLEATVAVDISGINLGLFYGKPSSEFRIDIELGVFKGSVEIELNAFDEIWLHIRPAGNSSKYTAEGSTTHLANLPSLSCAPWV